ncbi:hypothetical protein [Frondihabitans australicus]|uniref:Uncharacterized protein n=1 Tax=Frondihabitans australicus TaxID=386892 RepID=A0A495IJB1_9MICO|nr:hypothetical protein [Frondihabitans australicus]RKR75800.1 hypothetical protein C8E83_2956 [Frondihabitans australicus]
MDEATTSRSVDLAPESAASRRIGVIAVVCVVCAGLLRMIGPLTEFAKSGRHDSFDLWIALAVPIAIVVIVGVLVGIRVVPWRRAARLRVANPGAVLTTGQWAQETVAALPGSPAVGQMATYTLVVTPRGLEFHSGSGRSESTVAVPASDVVWVHSAREQLWQRSRAGLVVTTMSGSIPLLLVDFGRPLAMFQGPRSLGQVAEAARRALGLAGADAR